MRRENLASLLKEVQAWLATFNDLDELQTQVSEAGLAIGVVRSTSEFGASEWAREWNAVVEVDDRAGGTVLMPGNPWIFSKSELPSPGIPAFQGEQGEEILRESRLSEVEISEL
nr:CoA transferase [Bradyrhizobium oropedii]